MTLYGGKSSLSKNNTLDNFILMWIKILDNQVIGSYFFPENINISRGLFRFSGGNTTNCEKTDDFTIKSIIEKLIEKNDVFNNIL